MTDTQDGGNCEPREDGEDLNQAADGVLTAIFPFRVAHRAVPLYISLWRTV